MKQYQTLVYLASPYSHIDPTVRQSRYEAALKYVTENLDNTHFIYSPIVYCHHMGNFPGIDYSAEFWKHHNEFILDLASELWLLALPGWKDSLGVQAEITYALAANKRIKTIIDF
jgi:hypothetical protein